MADLSFIRRGDLPFCDLIMEGGDLKLGDELKTFVSKAILTDYRATKEEFQNAKVEGSEDDVTSLRGWWGDSYQNPVPGHRIGSKIWLNVRQKQTTKVLEDQIEYVKQALNPLVEDGVASKVDVFAEWRKASSSGDALMLMSVQIYKPDFTVEPFEYQFLWEGV